MLIAPRISRNELPFTLTRKGENRKKKARRCLFRILSSCALSTTELMPCGLTFFFLSSPQCRPWVDFLIASPHKEPRCKRIATHAPRPRSPEVPTWHPDVRSPLAGTSSSQKRKKERARGERHGNPACLMGSSEKPRGSSSFSLLRGRLPHPIRRRLCSVSVTPCETAAVASDATEYVPCGAPPMCLRA